MKMQIRQGVFETNSSSTHSLTMCSESEYKKWENGELYFDNWNDCLVTYEKIVEELKGRDCYKDVNFDNKEEVERAIECRGDYITHDRYFDDSYLEFFGDSYTTKDGEKIIAFGKYGFDG